MSYLGGKLSFDAEKFRRRNPVLGVGAKYGFGAKYGLGGDFFCCCSSNQLASLLPLQMSGIVANVTDMTDWHRHRYDRCNCVKNQDFATADVWQPIRKKKNMIYTELEIIKKMFGNQVLKFVHLCFSFFDSLSHAERGSCSVSPESRELRLMRILIHGKQLISMTFWRQN